MGPCTTCRFFRPFRPMSQLLARELGIADPQLVSELLKMMQDERQKQDAEASQKVEVHRQEQLEWRTRPEMSDYCGLREADGVYLIHELKNPDGECEDHRPAEPRPCSTCRHRVAGEGDANDQRMIARYGELARNAASLGQGSGDQGLKDYVSRIGVVKSFEAAQAYYAGKLTFRPPGYLPYCARYSADPDFVPCVVRNPHDRCEGWEVKAEAAQRPRDELTDALAALGSSLGR
jgi:hypothetical protein